MKNKKSSLNIDTYKSKHFNLSNYSIEKDNQTNTNENENKSMEGHENDNKHKGMYYICTTYAHIYIC